MMIEMFGTAPLIIVLAFFTSLALLGGLGIGIVLWVRRPRHDSQGKLGP
jgi:hypothetical protein